MSMPAPSTPNTRSSIRQILEGAIAANNSGYGRTAEKIWSPRAFLSLTRSGHYQPGCPCGDVRVVALGLVALRHGRSGRLSQLYGANLQFGLRPELIGCIGLHSRSHGRVRRNPALGGFDRDRQA